MGCVPARSIPNPSLESLSASVPESARTKTDAEWKLFQKRIVVAANPVGDSAEFLSFLYF